MLKQIRKINQ